MLAYFTVICFLLIFIPFVLAYRIFFILYQVISLSKSNFIALILLFLVSASWQVFYCEFSKWSIFVFIFVYEIILLINLWEFFEVWAKVVSPEMIFRIFYNDNCNLKFLTWVFVLLLIFKIYVFFYDTVCIYRLKTHVRAG